MAESILNGKRILAVDDEPDVLAVLEEEILAAAPKCKFEKAASYQEAIKKLESQNYDQAVKRNFQVAMLTAHSLNPESLKRSIEMNARAYLPKEKLGEIVPFLEDILEEPDRLSGWARQMNKLEGYFESRWGQDWQKTEAKFWKDFEKKTSPMKR
jgi:hypothetical protein